MTTFVRVVRLADWPGLPVELGPYAYLCFRHPGSERPDEIVPMVNGRPDPDDLRALSDEALAELARLVVIDPEFHVYPGHGA